MIHKQNVSEMHLDDDILKIWTKRVFTEHCSGDSELWTRVSYAAVHLVLVHIPPAIGGIMDTRSWGPGPAIGII